MPTRLLRSEDGVIRADAILAWAVLLVALVIVAFSSVAVSELTLHARTLQTISTARAIREEMLNFVIALAESEGASGPARTEAHARAETHLARFAELTAQNPAIVEDAAEIQALARQIMATPRPTSAAFDDLRAANRRLQGTLNAAIDADRQGEDAARTRLAVLAGVLSLLALAGSAVAIIAARRERAQWRKLHALSEAAARAAADADLAKTRFLAVASHDMRQPLHALTLYISALERRVQTDDARDILTKMDRATQSMVGMFATLLDLARVQTGGVKPELSDFALQEVIDRVVAHNPGGTVTAASTGAILHSDALLLEGALRNLVANAIRHGGGHAEILVADAEDGGVRLSVRDHGPGIAPADQDRIFEEFVRLEGRAGAQGLGIGLSIVRRIAALLGFRLALVSAPNAGATFSLVIPRSAIRADAAPRQEAAPVSLGGACVLAVDDDAFAREAMTQVIADMGGDVRAANGAEEAETIIAEGFQPALIIMDLRLDDALIGIELARRLNASLSTPARVIIVTGDTEPQTLATLRASGFPWLIKPVDPHALAAAAA